MPRREGIQTLIEIKRRWPQTRVIAISGGGRVGPADFLGLARGFGADATLAKPVTPSTVVETIRRLLDR
jgi:DNA-binding NarL/FixJ family response regulator